MHVFTSKSPATQTVRLALKATLRPWLRLAACGVLFFTGTRVDAATITWADTGSDFATGTDWTGNVAPKNDTTSDIATFGTVTNFQPNLAANRSVNGLAFTATSVVTLAGAGTLTLGNSGINNSSTSGLKTVNNALTLAAAQSFTNNGALTIAGPVTNGGFLLTLTGTGASGTLSGNIGGLGGLTKASSGTWIVSGANTYSGTTTVSAGTLRATTSAQALGAGALSLGGAAPGTPTLSLANDTGLNFGNSTTLTGGATIVSDVLTNGHAGVNHTLGTLTTGANTLTVTAGGNVGSGTAGITFGATSVTGNATFNTGANTLLTLGALNAAAARTVTKAGAGTLLFNAASTSWVTGSALTINNGTAQLGASNALGASALTNVTVNATTAGTTALFDLNGFNQTVLSLTFGGTGGTSTSTNNVSTGAGTLTLGGNVTLTNTGNPLGSTLSGNVDLGGATRTFTIGDSTNAPIDLTVSANISNVSGTAGLTKAGTGTLLLSGANTYNGATTLSAGTLRATTSAQALGAGALSLGGGTLSLGNDTGLNFGNNTTLTASTAIVSDVLTSGNAGVTHTLGTLSQGTSTLTLTEGANVGSGTAGLTFGATTLTGNATFSTGANTLLTLGALSDGGTARTVTKNGAGTLLLNAAAGTWTSGNSLTVNNGTLQLGASNALGASALSNVTVNATTAGATALFDLNGFNQSVLSLTFGGNNDTATSTNNVSTGAGTLTLGGSVTLTNTGNPLGSTLSGNLDLGGATRIFNIGDSTNAPIDLTVSAVISNVSGTAGLTKTGNGTLLLSSANTYNGITTLSAGTLRATNAQALGAGALSLGGGTLSLANDTGLNFGNNTTLAASTAIVSDVLTSGNAGVTHTLGTFSVGNATLTLTQGANVGSGTAGLTFGNTSITANNATFNTGANTLLTLGSLSDTAGRSMIKTGAGTVLFNAAAGTWSSGSSLTINNGTAQLGASNALGGSALTNITVNATTTGTTALLDLNGFNQSVLSLTFGGAGGTSTSTNNVSTGAGTLTLGGNVTLTNTGNPLGSTLSGNLDLGGATRTFAIADSTSAPADLTVSANISNVAGSAGLTKTGAGTLVLSGNNSYNGATTVSAGVLNLQSNTALGSSAAATSVTSGAALQLQNGITITGEALTLNGTGVATDGALRNISGSNTWTGNVTLGSAAQMQSDAGTLNVSGNVSSTNLGLTVAGAGDTNLSGVVGLGSGGLTKNGTGSLTLSGTSANTYTGATTINDGTVNLNKTAGLNAVGTGAITVGDGTGAASSANLVLMANSQIANTAAVTLNADGRLALNNFTGSVNTIAGTGLVDLGTSGYLTVGANNGSSTFGGSVAGGGTLEKAGSGTLTFNSSLNFAGTFTLSGGTVALNGFDLTVGTLHITGNTFLDFGNSSASILNATNLIIDSGFTLTISNWANTVNYFYVQNDPGGSQGNPPLNQINFGTPYTTADTKWQSYDQQITPAPEPAVYGAVLAGFSTLLLAWRRRRAALA